MGKGRATEEQPLTDAEQQHWGASWDRLSLPPRPPAGSRDFRLEAEDRLWARAQYLEREAQKRPSEVYAEALRAVGPGLSEDQFPPPDQTGLWKSMCESVKKEDAVVDKASVNVSCSVTDGSSSSKAYPCRCGDSGAVCTASEELCFAGDGKCKAVRPLDAYDVLSNKTCSDGNLLDVPTIQSEQEAYLACDGTCSAIVDVGCQRSSFRLCKMGAAHDDSSDSCLRMRVPGNAPPDSVPRPPLHGKFWKKFCTQNQTHSFRLLFKGRLCGGPVVDLGDSWTPDRCSELAGANPTCGEVFDFTKGQPSVCRCVRAGQDCAAPAPKGPKTEENKNVFLRTRLL